VSQLPEMPATGWPDQGYEPEAAAQWQQDTQPDWGGQQQEEEYPAGQYQGQAQEYQGQEHQAQAGHPQQGYPAQQQWAGQAEPTVAVPPQAAAEDSNAGLPTEFDHLFRDSTPDSRRAIDRQKPTVGGAAAGYLNGVQAQPEAAQQHQQQQQQQQETRAPQQPGGAAQNQDFQLFQQYPQRPADQYQQEQYQAEQYQAGQYQGQVPAGQYTQPEYQQSPGYGGDFNGAGFNNGGYDGGSGGGALRGRRPWIIGGAVVLAAAVGIAIALSGGGSPAAPAAGGSSPSASASKAGAKQQADQIYLLIQQSGQLRSDANTAVIDVNGCKNLSDAQSALAATAQKRQTQADSVAKLDVSGIKNGAQLVSRLQQAWTASAQYDTAYAQIAGDMQSGTCKTSAVKKDSNYKAASAAAGDADTAKSAAAQLWNDNVASALGEAQVTEAKL
jgi:hypothetical protein